MHDAASPLIALWDGIIARAEMLQPVDWSRPTPCPGLDVRGLVTHVGTGPGIAPGQLDGRPQLLRRLTTARAEQAARVAALGAVEAPTPGNRGENGYERRMLGAWCLDIYVHAYDLAAALGEPVKLDDRSPAVAEACGYLLRLTPHLFGTRCGAPEGATLRIALRGMPHADGTLRVVNGRGIWIPDVDAAADTVTATPAAYVLLLSGRGDPRRWRSAGALEWSGSTGEAFVATARLFGGTLAGPMIS